jgi:hypothetical protein
LSIAVQFAAFCRVNGLVTVPTEFAKVDNGAWELQFSHQCLHPLNQILAAPKLIRLGEDVGSVGPERKIIR